MINSRVRGITENKTIGCFSDGRLMFRKYFIRVLFFFFGFGSFGSMLIGLNKLAVLILIVRGFSLLPFKDV